MSVQSNEPVTQASPNPAYAAVVHLTDTDTFCQAHLTYDYQMLCPYFRM